MTRKHFTAAAIAFGAALRDCTTPEETYGASQIVHAFMDVAREANPNFDRDRFMEYVREVRDYERDLTGKKVKKAAA